MTDPSSYAVLKRRLAELHYTEYFPPDSAGIVDHLLQDLLKSVESFHLLKQRYEEVDKLSATAESALKPELDSLKQTTDSLKQTNDGLKQSNDSLKQSNSVLKHDLAALQTRYQMAIEKEESLTDKIQGLENEMQQLQKSDGKEQALLEELALLKHDKNKLQARLDALLKSPVDGEGPSGSKDLETVVERLQADLAQSNAEKVNSRTQLALKTAELEETQKELRQWKVRDQTNSLSSDQRQKEQDFLQTEMSHLMQNLHDLKDEKGSLQKFLEDRLQLLGAKDAEIARLKTEADLLRKDMESQARSVQDLKQELQSEQSMRQNFDMVEMRVKNENEELVANLGMLKRGKGELEEKAMLLSNENAILKQENEGWIEKLRAEKSKALNLEHELSQRQRTEVTNQTSFLQTEKELELRVKELTIKAESLTEENLKLREKNGEMMQDLAESKETLVTKVSEFHDGMSAIQQQILNLSEEKSNLVERQEQTEGELLRYKNEIVKELEAELSKLREEKDNTLLPKLKAVEDELSYYKNSVLPTSEKKVESYGEYLEEHMEEKLALVKELDRLREQQKGTTLSHEKASSDLALANADAKDLRQKLDNLEAQNKELALEKNQLTALMQALEQTREQLVAQLQETQRILDFERDSRKRLVEKSENLDEGEKVLQAEKQALQEALKELDRERDNLQEAADAKSAENRVLEIQIEDQNKREIALQSSVEELRRKLDLAGQQLTDRERQMQFQSDKIAELASTLEKSEAETLNLRREINVYASDLEVMTTENQTLNHELQKLSAKTRSADSELNDAMTTMQSNSQLLKVTEMERDDMIALYKENIEELQRQEKSISALNKEKIDLEKRAQDYAVRNKALIDAEERALSAARQEGLNVVALKQQVADLCQRLEGLTQEAESKFKREREYEQELMVSGEAVKQVELRRFNLERDLIAAKAEQDRSLHEVTRLKNDLQQEKELTKLERQRNAKLEALLAETRKSGNPGPGGGGSGGGSSVDVTPKMMSSCATGASRVFTPGGGTTNNGEEVSTLYKTLDQQYSLIGEMDAENQRLLKENEEMKKKFGV